LSDRSYPRYRKLGFLFRPLFGSLAGVGAQNEADAARLRAVGCRPEAVRVVGNLKFDTARPEEKRSLDVAGLLRQLGVPPEAPVLVAGSTHDGEELLLAEMARRLRAQFPNLVLILVPRHFERCPEIAKKLKAHGLPFFGRSEITATTQLRPGELECLLVNTTGELRFFYEQATVVFVGKSLTASGGQNPIEPAALGKATVLGPHMENFRDVTRALLAHDAALQVDDAEGLEMAVAGLLSDKPRRAELGRNALQVVAENRGALDRTTDMILEHLRARGVYETPENGPS
jgi:3-deoxy-D-manno-octulosonic-acid transferase